MGLLCLTRALALLGLFAVASATWKINCGGGALSGYSPDQRSYTSQSGAFVGSFFNKKGNTPTSIYSTHSWAARGKDLVYSLPVGPGTYTVKLQFAENWAGAGRKGVRVLHVDLNDNRVASSLDVYVSAGFRLYTPYEIVRTGVSPVNGRITVRIKAVRQNAYISGIEVSGGTAASPSPSPNSIQVPSPSPSSSPSPASEPTTVPASTGGSGSGSWRTVQANGNPTKRHEACAVMVAGKVYLIGGRGRKPVNVFDPVTRQWTAKGTPNDEMHHMQCAAYQNRFVYVAGAWYGGFPNEKSHTQTFVYDTVNDSWSTRAGLGSRARGGGAFALYNGKFYLAFGNRGGHGSQATTLAEFDEYDPATDRWRSLPNGLDARDHVGGGIVGNRFCVAGGRDGGVNDFWKKPITPVNCYNFATGRWERRANMPEGRAGAATGTTCGGLLMVAGGEGIPPGQSGKAFDRVDLYDVATNQFRTPVFLKRGRHGTGLAISSCSCGNIYYPSGSGGLGGGPELTSTEVWHPSGAVKNC